MQIEDRILTLAANNSAVAAKLRQMAPELITQLQLHGCEVTGIQVRVQVALPTQPRTKVPAAISDSGKKQLKALAESLKDSPLKAALQRLAGKNKG